MSRRLLILGGLAVLAAGVFLAFGRGPAPEGPSETRLTERGRDAGGVVRHAFLDDLMLGEDGAGHALLLHDQVTGEGLRVVRDGAALRAAQGTAFYTDKPGEATKQLLWSIVFLSPPGMPPNHAFISVLKDKEVQQTYTCFPPYCAQTRAYEVPHTRNLAGLVEASEPVALVTEEFDHHDKARAALFKLLQDDAVVMIDPPHLPAPNTIVFPERVRISLPAILLETDAAGQAPLEPFDEAALEARFVAAFTHAFPETEAYRLGEMQLSTSYPPQGGGWPVVAEGVEGHVRDADGQRIGLDRIMVIEPSVPVDVSEGMAEALRAGDGFDAMPEFLPREPESVARRLDGMAEAHFGRPCPDCFKIELPVATVERLRVDRLAPPSFRLSYYRIVTP